MQIVNNTPNGGLIPDFFREIQRLPYGKYFIVLKIPIAELVFPFERVTDAHGRDRVFPRSGFVDERLSGLFGVSFVLRFEEQIGELAAGYAGEVV